MNDCYFLAGGGEVGAKMRALDWATTELGPIEHWPQSLRTSVSTCLNSRFPILIWWGPHHVKLYNDAYAALLGHKHPSALGQRGRDCWPEIWHIIGPRLDAVLSRGEATWSENEMLLLNRRGNAEECYFNSSYSPIRDESGIGGVFCALTETTQQVLSERRLRSLRELATQAAATADEDAFCKAAVEVLVENKTDLPFALLFRAAEAGGLAELVAADGEELGATPPATLRIPVEDTHAEGIEMLDLDRPAALLRLRGIGSPSGYLVAGLSSRRMDSGYADFLTFAAEQVAAGVATARARAEERQRTEALAERASARLQEQLAELDTVMEALPVGVFIARDKASSVITANAAGAALLRLPRDANFSKTGAQREKLGFRVTQQGREVAPHDLSMQRAARTGLPVAGEEMDIIFDGGDVITLYEYATPLFDVSGEPRGSVGVFVDITERKQTERMLLQQNDLLERVALGSPLGECLRAICDAAPAISPGARACILLVDASRTAIESCISTNLPQSFSALIEGLLIDERMFETGGEAVYRGVTVTGQDAAGGELSAAWRQTCLDHGILASHCEPILGPDGAALGSFMLCLDHPRLPREHEQRLSKFAARIASIALERDRFTTALLESEARLREADQRKDEFLATLSHELRNPLAPLSNALQLLRRSAIDNEPNARIHDMMRRQVDHLVRLVDDLLETSRITRGVLELQKQRIDVAQVVKNAFESIEPMMQAAQHDLLLQLTEEELWLEGDPVRLAQILGNLLNNAAKYTAPRGLIELRVSRHGDCARIAVRDNGPGIDADTLPRIFDMFRSGRPLTNVTHSGLGIGLALARRLAEMHGGSIQAASEGPGKGAEFVVMLPLAQEQKATSIPEKAHEPAGLHRRILVVDDNVDAAESLGMLLTALGAEVRVAHDGYQALQVYASHQPVAVLLDIGMPGMDGYEVARRLRADFDEQPVMLIALTGWGQESDRRRAHAAGFDHHLIKPVDMTTLQKLLRSLDTAGDRPPRSSEAFSGSAGDRRS